MLVAPDEQASLAGLVPAGNLSGAWSATFAYGAGLLVLAGLTLIALSLARRYRQFANQADARIQSAAKLHAGHTTLRGIAELAESDDDRPHVASVRLEQAYREYRGKHGWSHTWTETGRSVSSSPFYLTLESGERVRIEPGANPVVAAPFRVETRMGLKYASHSNKPAAVGHREQTAFLCAGEPLFAMGVLVRGTPGREGETEDSAYRAVAGGWVLRAPHGSPVVLSSSPPGDDLRSAAKLHHRWALGIGALALVVNGLLLGPYHARATFGVVVDATVMGASSWTVRVKHGTERHYAVTGRYFDESDGTRTFARNECSADAYARVRENERRGAAAGALVLPFVVLPTRAWVRRLLPESSMSEIGAHATLGGGIAVMLVFIDVAVVGVYAFAILANRPWYVRRRVVQHGRGRVVS